jgi:two-component system, NtrC family, response regulator HydG
MGETVKVLVVDDDRRMVKTICDILKAKGFDAVHAFTGEEAVEKVGKEKPDCVLMDVKMPGIDGIEALRMIKELSPDLPVVMMSAYATGEQTDEAKCHGAYSVLTKPIDIQQVLSFLSMLRKEESILVVDDDPQFCKTLKDILQARNYQVETEDDPEMVLGHMELKYELVVLVDLKLGNADGLETLRDIRERYPTKPVVLVTGYREEMAASIEKGFQIGAYTCLYKPFETEELIGIIEEISRKKLRSFLGEPFQA